MKWKFIEKKNVVKIFVHAVNKIWIRIGGRQNEEAKEKLDLQSRPK